MISSYMLALMLALLPEPPKPCKCVRSIPDPSGRLRCATCGGALVVFEEEIKEFEETEKESP
jgi:hypothetical protein